MPEFSSTGDSSAQSNVIPFTSDAEHTKTLALAMRLLRETTDPDAKFTYITAAAEKLCEEHAALDQLSDTAIHAHGLDPDAVQMAITRGVNRGLDRQAERHVGPRKEPPRPLMREMPPADPFPIEALGVLAPAANAIHGRIQAPLAMCGQSVLAAATLAVQGLADVELPTGQTRPLSCFFVTVAGSGLRKTSVDIEALRPIKKKEAAMRKEYFDQLPGYQNDLVAWDKAREAATKKLGRDRAAIKEALDEIGEKPTPPWQPILTTDDITLEGLCKLFPSSRPSLGVFTSEGAQVMDGHGMADDAKKRTAAGLSKLWDGEEIKRVRADGTLILPDRRLSMHLMAQPGVAGDWLSDPHLTDQGLTSRVLLTAPETTVGNRPWKEWEGNADLAAYDRHVLALLEKPMAVDTATGGVRPRMLPLSATARRAYIDFYNECESQSGPGKKFEPIESLANKLAEHAGRLAAVLTMVANWEAGEISVEAMESGVALAKHYASEALRLFHGGATDPELALALRVLAWIKGDWKVFSLPDLYQRGPGSIRDKAAAAKVVRILADHGYVEQVAGGAEIDGKWRREAWKLVE